MTSAEYELRFIASGIELLENYLLSNDIYRTPGIRAHPGEPPYPQFTLGWLLLSRIKAEVRCRDLIQRTELERLQQEIEKIRSHWRTSRSKKAKAEFRARLNLWRDYLEEYRDNPRENSGRYAHEVNRRVLLDLLRNEADQIPDPEIEFLHGLDNLLKAVFVAGDFTWDDDLCPAFSKSSFWYLYGMPKQGEQV
jgi:hypothetical protein